MEDIDIFNPPIKFNKRGKQLFHYLYLICYPTGWFYVGQRQHHDPRNDKYIGSGTNCEFLENYFGLEKCTKFIIKIFPYNVVAVNIWETLLIIKYKELYPEFCLNTLDGPGHGILKCNPAKYPEVALKISISRKNFCKENPTPKGEDHWLYDKIQINNGINFKFWDKNLPIPEGWFIGQGGVIDKLGEKNPNYGNGDKIAGDKNPMKRPEIVAMFKGANNSNYGVPSPNRGIKKSEEECEKFRGEKNGNWGRIHINNGEETITINKNESIPEGWVKGGRIWINNGFEQKLSLPNKIINGWVLGRIPHKRKPFSEKTKNKMSISHTGKNMGENNPNYRNGKYCKNNIEEE